jgi:hypothetical protein
MPAYIHPMNLKRPASRVESRFEVSGSQNLVLDQIEIPSSMANV